MTEDKIREEGDFKVYINEGEMERIHEWVELKSDIETGGGIESFVSINPNIISRSREKYCDWIQSYHTQDDRVYTVMVK